MDLDIALVRLLNGLPPAQAWLSTLEEFKADGGTNRDGDTVTQATSAIAEALASLDSATSVFVNFDSCLKAMSQTHLIHHFVLGNVLSDVRSTLRRMIQRNEAISGTAQYFFEYLPQLDATYQELETEIWAQRLETGKVPWMQGRSSHRLGTGPLLGGRPLEGHVPAGQALPCWMFLVEGNVTEARRGKNVDDWKDIAPMVYAEYVPLLKHTYMKVVDRALMTDRLFAEPTGVLTALTTIEIATDSANFDNQIVDEDDIQKQDAV